MDNDVFSSDTIYLGMKIKEDNKWAPLGNAYLPVYLGGQNKSPTV